MNVPSKPAVPLPGFNNRDIFVHMCQETCTKCHGSLMASPEYSPPSPLEELEDLR